jgi:hypothetical protein
LPHTHTAEPLEKDGLIAAYEELRRQLLNGQRGPGLALFVRRGMREWMNGCSLCVAPSPTKEFTAAPDEACIPRRRNSAENLALTRQRSGKRSSMTLTRTTHRSSSCTADGSSLSANLSPAQKLLRLRTASRSG